MLQSALVHLAVRKLHVLVGASVLPRPLDWVAVKDLNSNYHNGDIL